MAAIGCYRIVDKKNGKIMSLFHGTGGSRVLPLNKWIRCDMKLVHDGTGGTPYMSGFHVFMSLDEAQKFFIRRFRKLDNRIIIVCEAYGLRLKEHSSNDKCKVYLADWIYITSTEDLRLVTIPYGSHGMLCFSARYKLAERIQAWCYQRCVSTTPFNIITALSVMGLLQNIDEER